MKRYLRKDCNDEKWGWSISLRVDKRILFVVSVFRLLMRLPRMPHLDIFKCYRTCTVCHSSASFCAQGRRSAFPPALATCAPKHSKASQMMPFTSAPLLSSPHYLLQTCSKNFHNKNKFSPQENFLFVQIICLQT